MSNEDLTQEEEVETTPTLESESDDATELEDLFAEHSQEEEATDVDSLKKEIADLKKGLSKFFSENGRKAKQVEEKKEEAKPETVPTDDVSELFFNQIPQAELVSSDLKSIADAKYNGSILKAWKGESWIQAKAKALSDERTVNEENKSKISKPTQGTTSSRIDVSKVKAEDVSTLSADKKAEWLREQVRRERESAE